jgi:hypothetical protein
VKGKESIPVLRLPREALRAGSQNEVFVLVGDRLASRRIAYSVSPDGTLLVRHGLAATEPVVLSPRTDAKAGDQVALKAAGAPNTVSAK